jgi:hypothetical protein
MRDESGPLIPHLVRHFVTDFAFRWQESRNWAFLSVPLPALTGVSPGAGQRVLTDEEIAGAKDRRAFQQQHTAGTAPRGVANQGR